MKKIIPILIVVVVYYALSINALKNYLNYDLRGLGINAQSNLITNPHLGTGVVTPNIMLFNNSLIPLFISQLKLQIFSPSGVLLAQNIYPINGLFLKPKSQVELSPNINIYPSQNLLNVVIQNTVLNGRLSLSLLGLPIKRDFQFRWTDIH